MKARFRTFSQVKKILCIHLYACVFFETVIFTVFSGKFSLPELGGKPVIPKMSLHQIWRTWNLLRTFHEGLQEPDADAALYLL